jgi:hypothetical protein
VTLELSETLLAEQSRRCCLLRHRATPVPLAAERRA